MGRYATNDPLFIEQIARYKAEVFYARFQDWTCTTLEIRKLSLAIISNMMALLPSYISLMFPNDTILASDGIAMIYLLLTHLNPSSIEKFPLSISDLTRLDMRLVESSIDYMLMVLGISKRMQGITMKSIIPLFDIISLDHDR